MYPALHTTASERVKALDFSEDGSGLLAVGLYSGEVHVVSADDGRAYRTFTIQDAAVRAVKFIPGAAVPLDLSAPDCRAPPALTEALPNCDGDEATLAPAAAAPCHLAAGCDDMHVYLYDVHGDVLLRTIKAHDDFIRCIALDPASPFVVTASDDATARVWSRGFELRQTLTGHAHYVMAAAVATLSHCLVGRCVATDGASLTAATIVATASLDTAVRLWFISDDSGRDSPVASTPCVLHGHAEGVSAVAFVRPTVGRLFVVSGSDDREIRLWDAATHCCVAVLLGHTHSVNAVLCSQHASGTLVSVGSDQQAIQWALSEANDRSWCGGAFTDVETMDIAQTADDAQDVRADAPIDYALLKERAVRDQTDLMMAPSDPLSGRGWAVAATVRDGRVHVAIGTDNGFEVSVRGTAPPSGPRHCASFVSDRTYQGDCSELVVGSHPDVVEKFDLRDDSVQDVASRAAGNRGSDLSDDENA